MRYKQYELAPIDLITDQSFNLREMYHIDIKWLTPVPQGGKAYRLWVLLKPHVNYMIYLMAVMSTEELYKIKLTIDEGLVPSAFAAIVDEFYQTKQKGGFVTQVNLTKLDIFDYTDHKKFAVPKTPKHSAKQLLPVVPAIHPKIPVATAREIQKVNHVEQLRKLIGI